MRPAELVFMAAQVAAADHVAEREHESDIVGQTCVWCLAIRGGADPLSVQETALGYLKATRPPERERPRRKARP